MARSFRFYEKKRGSRRTGPKKLGRASEAAFFAVFLLLGCGGLAGQFLFLAVPEYRVNHRFAEHTCTVLDKRIAETTDAGGTRYRPEIRIRYEVDDRTYVTWTYDARNAYSSGREEKQRVLDRFVVDARRPREYPCWVDPSDPGNAVLVRGYSGWTWLTLIVPVSFMILGGGGLIYTVIPWGRSAERRAALTQRVQQHDLLNGNGHARREFPHIPNGGDITNSPGTRLRFRLPIASSPAWAMIGTLTAALLWNGIVSVFLVIAVGGYLRGEPDWLLTLFVVPFVLAGIGLIVLFVRQVLVTTGIGPTWVEISDHPLRPGGAYELFVSQPGRLKFNRLNVRLVCEEEATYRQGTNTRAESHVVHQQEVLRREDFQLHRGLPFEAQCALDVPAAAMHSFRAEHNEIRWKLVVEGEVAGWPEYRRAFPVIVHPTGGKAPP